MPTASLAENVTLLLTKLGIPT